MINAKRIDLERVADLLRARGVPDVEIIDHWHGVTTLYAGPKRGDRWTVAASSSTGRVADLSEFAIGVDDPMSDPDPADMVIPDESASEDQLAELIIEFIAQQGEGS